MVRWWIENLYGFASKIRPKKPLWHFMCLIGYNVYGKYINCLWPLWTFRTQHILHNSIYDWALGKLAPFVYRCSFGHNPNSYKYFLQFSHKTLNQFFSQVNWEHTWDNPIPLYLSSSILMHLQSDDINNENINQSHSYLNCLNLTDCILYGLFFFFFRFAGTAYAGPSVSGCTGTETDKQIGMWERRIKGLRRMLLGWDQTKPPDPPNFIAIDVTSTNSANLRIQESGDGPIATKFKGELVLK